MQRGNSHWIIRPGTLSSFCKREFILPEERNRFKNDRQSQSQVRRTNSRVIDQAGSPSEWVMLCWRKMELSVRLLCHQMKTRRCTGWPSSWYLILRKSQVFGRQSLKNRTSIFDAIDNVWAGSIPDSICADDLKGEWESHRVVTDGNDVWLIRANVRGAYTLAEQLSVYRI